MVIRIGGKDTHLCFLKLFGFQLMQAPCITCRKWVEQGGGLCKVCRTLDRFFAYIRGVEFLPSGGQDILGKLRTWIGEAQDLGEHHRQIAPNPTGSLAFNPDIPGLPYPFPRVVEGPPGIGAKSRPQEPPERLTAEEAAKRRAETVSPAADVVKEEQAPERSASKPRSRRKKRSKSTSPRRKTKRKRKFQSSGRSPIARKSPRTPVSPASGSRKEKKIKEEDNSPKPEEEDTRARPTHKRDLGPREPDTAPPGDLGGRTGVAASSRPIRREWQGIIAGKESFQLTEEDLGEKKERIGITTLPEGSGKDDQQLQGPLQPKPRPRPRRKGMPKAKPKPCMVPRQGILKRPGARGGAIPGKPVGGEILKATEVTLEECRGLHDIEVVQGSYWSERVEAAVKVHQVVMEGGELYLKGQLQGTESENLLKAASGLEGSGCLYTFAKQTAEKCLTRTTSFMSRSSEK